MFDRSQAKTDHPAPIPTFAPEQDVVATLHTNHGDIVCRLHAAACPRTVGNFVGLATGQTPWKDKSGATLERPLYDNTVFHRVISDFMVQAGDPEGTGRGGPGYRFADEIVASLRHDKPGILSMANAGPNTNGSQFFITERATPWLDGRHAVFGEVTEGMDVVHAIAAVDRDDADRPRNDVVLHRVSVAAAQAPSPADEK